MVAFIVHLVLELLFVLNNISDRKTGSKKGSCTLQTTQRFNWELGPNCWRRWGGRMSASKVTIQDATLQRKSLFRGKARDWTASESVLRGRVFTRMFNNYFGHFFFQGQAIFYDDMVSCRVLVQTSQGGFNTQTDEALTLKVNFPRPMFLQVAWHLF